MWRGSGFVDKPDQLRKVVNAGMRHGDRLVKVAHVRAGIEDRPHTDLRRAENVGRRIVADKPDIGRGQVCGAQGIVEDERFGLAATGSKR